MELLGNAFTGKIHQNLAKLSLENHIA